MLPTRQPASCSLNWTPRMFAGLPSTELMSTSVPRNFVFGNAGATVFSGPKAKSTPFAITS